MARFERVALPYSGGVLDQPARTMEALEHIEAVAATVLTEANKARGKKKEFRAGTRTPRRRAPRRRRRR